MEPGAGDGRLQAIRDWTSARISYRAANRDNYTRWPFVSTADWAVIPIGLATRRPWYQDASGWTCIHNFSLELQEVLNVELPGEGG